MNVDHPKGGPKARFFLAFGFDRARPEVMAEALITHFTDGDRMLRAQAAAGTHRLIVEAPMRTPDGRNPRIRTVWQLQEGLAWRLITAVPLTRR